VRRVAGGVGPRARDRHGEFPGRDPPRGDRPRPGVGLGVNLDEGGVQAAAPGPTNATPTLPERTRMSMTHNRSWARADQPLPIGADRRCYAATASRPRADPRRSPGRGSLSPLWSNSLRRRAPPSSSDRPPAEPNAGKSATVGHPPGSRHARRVGSQPAAGANSGGIRAFRRSTRSPRIGTPSRISSSRCTGPFGRLPSERTTRCQGNPWVVASTRPTSRGARGSMSP
jgi:hypothetical protein